MRYRAPRGTFDILPREQRYWRHVEATAMAVAHRYGYQRIDTPIFEDTGLFVHTVGEATDIVEKEMYTFHDRGNDSLTLRPEGTAPVCRAYLQHGMHTLPQPVRLYYFCPLFRYDRPQAGRFRQFHQFGVEAIGDGDPAVDAEVIDLAWRFYTELGLRNLSPAINSIGDPHCRPQYLKRLVEHYTPHLQRLCPDCRTRLHRNPLRLLDCKQDSCLPLAAGAPHTTDHLCNACHQHWQRLTSYLEALGIPYTVNHRLVRGLDYYTRTVFEIQPPEEGAQSTLCGGGRYDGLIEELGGRPTPGVGFALGMERTILNLKRQEVPIPVEKHPQVGIAALGNRAQREGMRLATQLRDRGVEAVVLPPGKSLKGQMRHASSLALRYVVILGDRELDKETALLRDLEKGEQKEVRLDSMAGEVGRAQRLWSGPKARC